MMLAVSRALVPRLTRTNVCVSVRFVNNDNDDNNKGDSVKQPRAPRDLSQSKEAREKLAKLLQRQKEEKMVNDDNDDKMASEKLKLAKPKKFNVHEPKVDTEGISPELKSAADGVASALGKGEPGEIISTKTSLLKKLSEVEKETAEVRRQGGQMAKGDRMSFLLSMQIDKTPLRPKVRTRERELTDEQMRFIERRKALRRGQREEDQSVEDDNNGNERRSRYRRFDLKSGVPLNIFSPSKSTETEEQASKPTLLETWSLCEEREMRIWRTHPPRNAFEDMAQLTEEGKLWHFPINNEQGLNEDDLEPFHEHVFLEHHLEPWCPKSGPVRHFMELVCIGLQRNPYITVEKKLGHIKWFKEYFDDKEHKEILFLSGALPTEEDEKYSSA